MKLIFKGMLILNLISAGFSNLHRINKFNNLDYYETGLSYLNNNSNHLGIVILAGGEGSRLGIKGSKGLFELNGKVVFEYLLEKIKVLKDSSSAKISLLIMTSNTVESDTRGFFNRKDLSKYCDYFDIFLQGHSTALNLDGEEFVSEKGNKKIAPNGNGDFFNKVKTSSLYEKIDHFLVIPVDNIFVELFDPVFYGCAIKENYDIFNKGIEVDKAEKVGCFKFDGNKVTVTEYIDHNEDNYIGNICFHLFTKDAVELLSEAQLDTHSATKTYVEDDITYTIVKKEKFIFDNFNLVNKSGVMVVDREEEFHPLKSQDDVEKILLLINQKIN
ncbi:UAP1 [Hepatospora eriocheir]|uniref:UDP-N-acetylglucosamine diphosphorylase n=1 Tax=Hepatospora eriocheir TaxID=1081669 RepID=A0A1X0QBU7_9MICR|nr:UAP1 [Hepatospora eriocheir]